VCLYQVAGSFGNRLLFHSFLKFVTLMAQVPWGPIMPWGEGGIFSKGLFLERLVLEDPIHIVMSPPKPDHSILVRLDCVLIIGSCKEGEDTSPAGHELLDEPSDGPDQSPW